MRGHVPGTTHSFATYPPGGHHRLPSQEPAHLARGARDQGDRWALEGGDPASLVRWTQTTVRAGAAATQRQPEGDHPATAWDGRARDRIPGDLQRGAASGGILGDEA